MVEHSNSKYFKSNSPLRRCTKCREVLNRDKFYKNRATFSGLDNCCKLCRNIIGKFNRGRFAFSYRFVKDAKIRIFRGKLACTCCGNKNFEWLQIDHVIPMKSSNKDRSKKGESIAKISREIIQGKRSDS